MADSSLLENAVVYLLVALVAVPGAKRFGLGPVLGYLIAGIFIGPWGIALIHKAGNIDVLTSFSTLVLLFLTALQATPRRIQLLVTELFSLGVWQFLLTSLVILIIALLIGLPWHHSLVAALSLSLSSGAIASSAFGVRYPAGSPLTDAGKRLLLTQGLLMLPLLVIVPLLGFDDAISRASAGPRFVTAIVFLVAVGLFARFLLRHAFRLVVAVGLDEVFAAFALLLVVATLLTMQWLDLPLELGAVVAGLLLTRSEYGSAINVAIRPFRGLLIGLFFLSIGMTIDFASFTAKPAETLALVGLLVVVKTWVLRTLLRYSQVPRRQRIWLATVLSQGGELAFVLIAFSVDYFAIPVKLGSQLSMVIALSMLTTPLLLFFADRREVIAAPSQSNTGLAVGDRANSQVIVAGFGRVGRIIARLLQRNGTRLAVIDHNPDRFNDLRSEGFVGFYGDALRPDLLKAAGIDRAAVVVIAMDDPERAEELTRRLRREHPHITLLARAVDQVSRKRLLDARADRSYRETFETALLMGEDVLELVGVSPLDAQAMTEAFRDEENADETGGNP